MNIIEKLKGRPEGRLIIAIPLLTFIIFTIHTVEKGKRESRDTLRATACLDELSNCERIEVRDLKIDDTLQSQIRTRLDEFKIIGPAIECIKKDGYSHKCDDTELDKVAEYDEAVAVKLALVIASKQKEDASRRDAYSQNLQKQKSQKQGSYRHKRILDRDNSRQSNEIASTILSVACGARNGIIPRQSGGAILNNKLESIGFSGTDVYKNWDFYWQVARTMDNQLQSDCIK